MKAIEGIVVCNKPRKLRRSDIRGTDFAALAQRLQELGFRRGELRTKQYTRPNLPYQYLRTYWTFYKNNTVVQLRISPHGTRMLIKLRGVVKLRVTAVTSNWLEQPFLKYFGGEPWWIRRIGRQPQKIIKWLELQCARAMRQAIRNGKKLPSNPLLRMPNYAISPAVKRKVRRN